ncbi:MAG: SGNH/GDSL hydrolase family protein [Chloroflexota bacterium]
MKKILSTLSGLLLSLAFTLLLIEAGLRFFPKVIPLDLLIQFNDKPRTEIARRVGLKTKGETILLNRDDGGPELRIFKPYTTVVWPIEDDGTFSVVVMDKNGFCNPPAEAAATQVEIITLGDSFTWCHAVDPQAAWAGQLARLTGRPVYNLGLGGIGPYEYIQLLKKFGLPRSPRLVIMNIYEGNDLRDVARYYYHRLYHQDDEPVTAAAPTPPAGVAVDGAGWLGNYSYAYNLALATKRYWAESDPAPAPITGAAGSDSPSKAENFRYRLVFPTQTVEFNPDNADTDEIEYARQLYQQELKFEVLAALRQPLEEFVTLARQEKFIPVVTYTPSAYTAYEAVVAFEDPALAEVMPWFSRRQRDFLAGQAQELGYTFIDLTPALQAAAHARGASELLYYRYDLHLTVAGHAVVAETLGQTLPELNLLQ